MNAFPTVFRRFIPQVMHMLILPVSFFVFLLVYRPMEIQDVLGTSYFGVHITLMACIVFLSAVIVRFLYYFLPLKMNYALYVFWCFAEMIFMSFFVAMYFWLVLRKGTPYYENLTISFQLVSLTLVIPYVILSLSLRVHDYHEKSEIASEPINHKRMRFYDQKHNLKLVLVPQSILYISSDENYVNINYMENDRQRAYVLRSSMKAIEELCVENGLIRCHRSYIVNPLHIKVLRKDKEGVVYAELDAPEAGNVPVSKRYYDSLAALL